MSVQHQQQQRQTLGKDLHAQAFGLCTSGACRALGTPQADCSVLPRCAAYTSVVFNCGVELCKSVLTGIPNHKSAINGLAHTVYFERW
jgi:hypothetical protein